MPRGTATCPGTTLRATIVGSRCATPRRPNFILGPTSRVLLALVQTMLKTAKSRTLNFFWWHEGAKVLRWVVPEHQRRSGPTEGAFRNRQSMGRRERGDPRVFRKKQRGARIAKDNCYSKEQLSFEWPFKNIN